VGAEPRWQACAVNEPQEGANYRSSSAPPDYVERLSVPWWGWVLVAMVSLAGGIALGAPFGRGWGVGSGALIFLVTTAITRRSTAIIQIRGGQLVAGRAHLDLRFIGRAEELDHEQARHLRGPGADSRAWMLVRGWIPTAIRLDITDPADPTPYWFVSTRQPQMLIAALQRATLRRWNDAS